MSAIAMSMALQPWVGDTFEFFEHGADIERALLNQPAHPYAPPLFHKIDSPSGPLFVLDYRSRYWLMDGDLIELFGIELERHSETAFLHRMVRRNLVRFAGRHALGGVMETDAAQQTTCRAVVFFDHEAVLAFADLLMRFARDWPQVGLVHSWVLFNGIAKAVAAAEGGAK